MVETLDKYMLMLITMVFLNKHVKLILPRILNNSVALTFKNAKTASLHLELNQEIKVIAGLNQNTQFGKSMNMEQLQVLKK